MTLKRTFLCIFIAITALFVFTGCGENYKAIDAELHQKLMSNAWVPVEDDKAAYDSEGNLVQFSVYEFTETLTKVHIVQAATTNTFKANDYTIKEGKFRADVDGVVMYAKIDFNQSGNLLWITDDMTQEFRPLTYEEIIEFNVPVGKTMSFEEGWDNAPAAE
ncbi:MAG: hypothetical protein IJF18_07250 [Oscillospiraceae bacterium]|nr:hypothetical protein [Oscillospiraceae bacterium]